MKFMPFTGVSRERRAFGFAGAVKAAALLLGMGCLVPAARAQTTGILSGRVTNSQAQPVSVLVHLLAEGDIPAGDVYTDSNGSYVFMGLPSGTFAVIVNLEGYKPFRQSVRLEDNVQPRAQLMVVLEPVTMQSAPNASVVVGARSSGELNAKHPLPPLDPKAAKEYDKGNKARENRDLRAALEHYQKALRIDPNFYPALNNMGALYEQHGNHVQAEEAFLKALRISPDDGESYINLGHVLFEEGQYRPAIDRLNQGLDRSPHSAAGNFFLGSVYYKLHELEKAEPLLRQACVLDPQHMAPAHLQLANLYLLRRQYLAARVQLETYLRQNPSDPQVPAIKKRLADIAKESGQ